MLWSHRLFDHGVGQLDLGGLGVVQTGLESVSDGQEFIEIVGAAGLLQPLIIQGKALLFELLRNP